MVYDIIIIGSGAAGLAAANFAVLKGATVLVIESSQYIGGTSALSAGTVWAPNTHHSQNDSFADAEKFLDGVVGNFAPKFLRNAFLHAAPQAIKTLEKAGVMFRPYAKHPDYEQTHQGATLNGRALEPLPFDGRLLGGNLNKLRPPIPEFTIFNGMMVDRTDINHLLNLTTSFASFTHAVKILARYGRDKLTHPRGTRLLMGNALIARLYHALLKANVTFLTHTQVLSLKEGCVKTMQGDFTAAKAIILAGGGFSPNATRPQILNTQSGEPSELQQLALKAGARLSEGQAEDFFYAPVSTRQRKEGSTAVFPHFVLDRGKPRMICVDVEGKRFINEATSYHNFVRAMRRLNLPYCWLITDSIGLKKYGLGMVRPNARNPKGDAYLIKAETLAGLAEQLALPAATLQATLTRFNAFAKTGVDDDFQRGTTPYHHHNGDAAHLPNPNLGEINTAPFYAIKLEKGVIGAAKGLVTNEKAQVLNAQNAPLKGLYAIGNDAQSIMGGTYPGPGITLGPAIVFAYLAMEEAFK